MAWRKSLSTGFSIFENKFPAIVRPLAQPGKFGDTLRCNQCAQGLLIIPAQAQEVEAGDKPLRFR